jgi:adhesin transport system outer membrane protein
VKASDATRDAYAKQFAIGQRTLLDLLDSENEYFTSRSTYINALFIELSARFRVLNAMGNLMQALEIKPPPEALARVAATMMPAEEKQADAPKAQRAAVASEQPAPAQPSAAKAEEPRAQEKPAEEKRSAARQPEPRSEVLQPVPVAQAPVVPVVAGPAPAPAPALKQPEPAAPQTQSGNASVEERRLTLQD